MSLSMSPRIARALSAALAICATLFGSDALQAQQKPLEMPQARGRNEYMVTGRMRAVGAPRFVLAPWFDEHSGHWSEGQRNVSYGGQFTWRVQGDYELGVAIDWAELSMPDAFWLQKDKAPQKAEFTTVDLQMLSMVFTSHWYWDPAPWLSPYLGVGLGAGVLLGDVLQYEPAPNSACEQNLGKGDTFSAPECFDSSGNPDPSQFTADSPSKPERMPPVVPVLNLSAGLRFNIQDYGVVRLEVGLNDYLYAGLGVGVQWW